MRIVSLLPSLTELICALGRADDLVGVTHECDFPSGVEKLPHLTRSRLPHAASSSEIDALVSQHAGSIYELDENLLSKLRPDLILTQEQCDVCAVNENTVRRAARRLSGSVEVISVNPTTLAQVWAMFRRVADRTGDVERAGALVARFEATAGEIARRCASVNTGETSKARPRVLLLEWLDPPYCSGHWNPEIIGVAGGVEVLGRTGEKSRRITWDEISQCRADVIVVAPCGYPLEESAAEVERLGNRPEWTALRAVQTGRATAVDGSAYFSRPGPRLETSLRIAAGAIDRARCGDLAPPEGHGWRAMPLRS
jgi:iron complex transport system substrate-binding protein